MTAVMDVKKYDKVVFEKLSTIDEPKSKINVKSQENKLQSIINNRQIRGMLLGLIHYTCGGFLSGYSSILLDQMYNDDNSRMNNSLISWIAPIAVLPMAPFSLLSGILVNKVQKKILLIILTLLEILSWIIIYFHKSLLVLLIGRALNGTVNAMASPIVPPYLAEITHPKIRGMALSLILLGLSVGLLVIHVLGAFFSWKTCALIQIGILAIYLLLVITSKESYTWYLRNNKLEEAEKAFVWYRKKNSDANDEIKKLLVRQNHTKLNKLSPTELFRLYTSKLLLKPLFITIVGMFTMHFSGNKAIIFHSISIMSNIIPSLNQYASTVIVDVIRIIVVIMSGILIKRVSVRRIFIISGTGSAISHICFAAFTYHATGNNAQLFQIFALISLLLYTVFSTFGIAPLAWIIAGEIFPLSVKGVGSGLACFFYYMSFSIVVKTSPDLFDAFGLAGGFLCFGGCTILGTVIMYFILPETNNKTLEEIEELFRK